MFLDVLDHLLLDNITILNATLQIVILLSSLDWHLFEGTFGDHEGQKRHDNEDEGECSPHSCIRDQIKFNHLVTIHDNNTILGVAGKHKGNEGGKCSTS